ncbi:MAG: Hsp70 family protein [Desulfotignum sp.]|nr:Hsp70 family protein [Desulfotignum sp.]
MSKSVGIDLGTTNSAIGIKKIQVEVIPNKENGMITPSCVALRQKKNLLGRFGKTEFIVGKHALEWLKQDPANTVTAVKRLMGRSFDNPEVQKLVSDPRQVITIGCQTRGTENSLVLVLNQKEYTPEAISSEILKKLCADAGAYLKDTVEFAVITVPAYFNDKQKHATRTAAALAGIKVQRLLPEPTAAAISFGVDQVNDADVNTVLVFDFGGGTFDLSVLTISGGQFIEQGKGGNMWLGGEDIDRKLMDHVLEITARENDIENIHSLIDQQTDHVKNQFLGELKGQVEQAKIKLSQEQEAYIEILGLLKDEDGDLLDVDVTLTRDRFETLVQPVVDTAMDLTRRLLTDIHIPADLIDRVLLVGGSSHIPCIIAAVQQMFGAKKVLVHDRPMLAIAEGAAILSHRLSETYECAGCGKPVTQTDATCRHCGFDLEKHTIDQGVLDIVHSTAHDYYVVLENNEKYLFIEKNTPLPCEQTEVFKLVQEDQQLVHMKFFNRVNEIEESIGDLWLGIDNETLNKYLNNLSDSDESAVLSIEVTLKIDENNLVSVDAALREFPDVHLSRTLSRGRADEALFRKVETMINDANEKQLSSYIMDDMTTRIVSTIQDIHQVIDPDSGQVVEPVHQLAEMKIDKTRRFSENDITCYSTIYFAQDALDQFAMLLSTQDQARFQKKIDHLKQMNLTGSYEKNLSAYEDLCRCIDDFPHIVLLMQIKKAQELCNQHDPDRAGTFENALSKLMGAIIKEDIELTKDVIDDIMPKVNKTLNEFDRETGTIHKGITR